MPNQPDEIVQVDVIEDVKDETSAIESLAPEPLSPAEQKLREELEQEIKEAFYRAGQALLQIREKKLYRSTHSTFEAYCAETFGFTRRYPYYLMEAATIVENLKQCERAVHILPTNEFQIRPLAALSAEEQAEAWLEALERSDGKAPSHNLVKAVVKEKKETEKGFLSPVTAGQACLIKRTSSQPNISSGWGFVMASDEKETTVELWNGSTQIVSTQLVTELAHDQKALNRLKKLKNRLSALAACDSLEESGKMLLDYFGHRQSQEELTHLEAALLSVLEREYLKRDKASETMGANN